MEHDHHKESMPQEFLQIIRAVVGAVRAVRTYPPGNPVHSQTITRLLNTLAPHLASKRELRIGVHKSNFSIRSIQPDREAQEFHGIAADLFDKGVREIIFLEGVLQKELVDFLSVLSIPKEDIKHGTESMETILWEKGLAHITMTFADLDQVIVQDARQAQAPARPAGTVDADLWKKTTPGWLEGREITLSGRRIVLGELTSNPGQFGASLVDVVKIPGNSFDQQLTQLFDSYREAGRQLGSYEPAQKALLFRALAESILAMGPAFRDGLIAGKLYGEADRLALHQEKEGPHEHVPNEMHERLSGRIAETWTPDQVAALLDRVSIAAPDDAPPPDYRGTPLDKDLQAIARELSEYTAEEIETFKFLTESGKDEDIARAALHTITSVLPLMEEFLAALPPDRALQQFSNLLGQLDDLLIAFVKSKAYTTAAQIFRTFQMKAPTLFQPRLAESLRMAADRSIVSVLISDLRSLPRDSVGHQAAKAYLAQLDRMATPALLEILASEEDRSARKLITQFLKDVGKSDISLLGDHITDPRWYFVRNIVMLLGESGSEEALPFLKKAADHESNHVRQAVVKALVTIGSGKARPLLLHLLGDKDPEVQLSAVAAVGAFPGAGQSEARAIIDLLKKSGDNAPTHEFSKEAISVLGKIGNAEAEKALQEYSRIRWWKPKQSQEELKAAAEKALDDIGRRRGNV